MAVAHSAMTICLVCHRGRRFFSFEDGIVLLIKILDGDTRLIVVAVKMIQLFCNGAVAEFFCKVPLTLSR